MHQLKCVVCKIRVRAQEQPAGGVGELCPVCGSLLEPVRNLSELVGLQERRREEADELAEGFDASPWLDDGGSVTPEAVARALSLPAPRSLDV